MFQLINQSLNDNVEIFQTSTPNNCQEYSEIDSSSLDQHHYRTWQMLAKFKNVCTDYYSFESQRKNQERLRNGFTARGRAYEEYWGSLYGELVRNDYELVQFLADSLNQIALNKNLDELETAELVVAFVQDIPYNYIKVDACANESKPCYGNAKYGILSPYEFIHTLSGDCDTRAVLLFSMLSYLGYDPMVVISENYLHAMLALNLPTSGDYLTHKGKRYYFWETTARGWSLGLLPPSYKNVNYWKVALVQ